MTTGTNTKIVKNTIFLFFRMLLRMGIHLYASRIILEQLGVVDLGIYNVTGGVVTMLSFMTSSFSTATQRFLSYEMGNNNLIKLKQIFMTSIYIHIFVSLFFLFIAETIGLWFLYNKLVIPPERFFAAFWVYQLSILTTIVTIMSIPYSAVIISNERMKIYAYISIVEVVLVLLSVLGLKYFYTDKLILYSVFLLIIAVIIRFFNWIYCIQKFPEVKIPKYFFDKKLFVTMSSYAGWNLFGNFSSMMSGQGVNILLNLFFGPIINAARGLAFQVQSALMSFANNIIIASRPQIIKYYAAQELQKMKNLVFLSSKASFFLLLLLTIPFFTASDLLLNLWLKEVPSYLSDFLGLILLATLIRVLTEPLHICMHATGKIKIYQIIDGSILLLNIPLSYLLLKWGFNPSSVFYSMILINFLGLVTLLFLVKSVMDFSILDYIKSVLIHVVIVVVVTLLLFYITSTFDLNTWGMIFLNEIMTFFVIVLLGTNSSEKKQLYSKFNSLLNVFFKAIK